MNSVRLLTTQTQTRSFAWVSAGSDVMAPKFPPDCSKILATAGRLSSGAV